MSETIPPPATPEPHEAVRVTPSRKRTVLVPFLIAGGALVAAGVAAGAYYFAMQPSPLVRVAEECAGTRPVALAMNPGVAPEEIVWTTADEETYSPYLAGVVQLEDDGKTLIVETHPDDEDPLGVGLTAVSCVQEQLDMPARIVKSMSATRSVDGRQRDEWDGYTAQWSYGPSTGLNLIVATR